MTADQSFFISIAQNIGDFSLSRVSASLWLIQLQLDS